MATEKKDIPTILQQVQSAVDFIVGGWENSLVDGHITIREFPTVMELVQEVYSSLMACSYYPGCEISTPAMEIVDCSESFLKGIIYREVVMAVTSITAGYSDDLHVSCM